MHNVKLKLEQILEVQDKTMYALAKDTGISYTTVYKLAKKEVKQIDLTILDRICEYLKVTPNDILPIPSN